MIAVYALLAVLVLIGWQQFYKKHWLRGIRFRLRFGSESVRAGESVTLSEIVENAKKLPVPVLEAGFRVPAGIRFLDGENIVRSDYLYKRDVFSLLGMECITRRYHLICEKRGRYPVSQMTLNCPSLLHLYTYYQEIDCDDVLYVYAAGTDIRGILPSLISILGDADAQRRVIEDPFTFAGIRSYTIQDPMKNINWKASARGGGLMVNTFHSVRADQAMILLDLEDKRIVKRDSLTEEAISLAASLCRYLVRNRCSIGFAMNVIENSDDLNGAPGPLIIENASGDDHLARIERALTLNLSGQRLMPFPEMARQVLEKEHSFIPVLISVNADEKSCRALADACCHETAAAWVLPCYAGERSDGAIHEADQMGTVKIIRREVAV